MIELVQDASLIESLLRIKNVSVIGLLLTIIAILIFEIRSSRSELKDKEKRINEVIDNHLQDLKSHGQSMFEVYKLYSKLADEIKDIVRGSK